MQWLETELPAAKLRCIYCATQSSFAHWGSFEHMGLEFALFKCPACESLIYNPAEFLFPITKPYSEAYKAVIRREIKYYFETGYSMDFVTMCALFAMAGVPKSLWKDHLFVDVGAGPGIGSYLIQSLFDIETLVIEPSYSGELGKEILGMNIHNAFFEELPADVLALLSRKPTLLHLNSVVEHLRDPAGVIRELMQRTEISAIAAVVPHAPGIDKTAAFSGMLPYLAPGDHQHLPTAEGMVRLFRSLGFKHCEVRPFGALLLALGSRQPVSSFPTQDEIEKTRDDFLCRLLEHPNEHVAMGAVARLLPEAVGLQKQPLLGKLRTRLAKPHLDPVRLLAILNDPDSSWDDIPFHLPTTGFWMAADASAHSDLEKGLAWLDVVDAFAERLWKDHPHLAQQSVDYLWEGRLLRANMLIVAAEKCTQTVADSAPDHLRRARPDQLQRAQDLLLRLSAQRPASVTVLVDVKPPIPDSVADVA